MSRVLKQNLKSVEYSPAAEYVFTYKGNKIGSFKTAFNGALRRSGVKRFTFHDLRHTFASNLVMNGVDIVTVAELMGHKDLSMTKRYSHPTPEHKKQAIKSLNFNNLNSREIHLEAIEKLEST